MTRPIIFLKLSIGIALICSCSVGQRHSSNISDQPLYVSKEGTRLTLVRYNPCFCGLKENDSVIDFEVGMISEESLLKQLNSASYLLEKDSSSSKIMSLKEHLTMTQILGSSLVSDRKNVRWERVVAITASLTESSKALTKAILAWWVNNPTQYLLLKVNFQGVKQTAQGHQFRTLDVLEIAGFQEQSVNTIQQND